MKISLAKRYRVVVITGAALLSITLIAWNQHPAYQRVGQTVYADTLPLDNRKLQSRDLDRELQKLDRALEELQSKKAADWDRIAKTINKELNEVNIADALKEAQRAMKEIDIDKINIELHNALKDVEIKLDLEKLDETLAGLNNESLAKLGVEIDKEEIGLAMAEVKSSLKKGLAETRKFDAAELKKAIAELDKNEVLSELTNELDRVKELSGKEMAKLGTELEKAKEGLEAARIELGTYQEMIYSMEKDQLLDTKRDYKIVYQKGALYINEKKQPEEVINKYRKFLKKDLTITKTADNININKNGNTQFD